MATEIPEGWASWKAQRTWVMARIQPSSECCVSSWSSETPFVSARDLKAATGFPGQKTPLFRDLKESLRARNAEVKEIFNKEYKLHSLTFAERNVDRKWDRVTFSDESTFSSTNDGPVLVYWPLGERYNCQCTSACKYTGRVSVHYWGRISSERAGMLHRKEGHVDGLQYQHILQNVMVPSVWMLYPDCLICFQQHHSHIHVDTSSQFPKSIASTR
jgi:hypothetical protein